MKEEVIAYTDPKSPVSEMFKTLRTNIQFMNSDKDLKTLLVTSTLPGEGKSWTTANLAVTFAQAGKKVLIIDADMRKGRQFSIFEVPPTPGLSNYLSDIVDGESVDYDLQFYIKPTEIEDLDILPAGNVPPNPTELLVSEKMLGLIKKVDTMYDITIFDGTPGLIVADASILSRIVDSSIIVTAHNETKIDNVSEVKKSIENIGGKVAGVVINKIPTSSKKYDNTYYYYGHTTMPAVIKDKKKKHKHKHEEIEDVDYYDNEDKNEELFAKQAKMLKKHKKDNKKQKYSMKAESSPIGKIKQTELDIKNDENKNNDTQLNPVVEQPKVEVPQIATEIAAQIASQLASQLGQQQATPQVEPTQVEEKNVTPTVIPTTEVEEKIVTEPEIPQTVAQIKPQIVAEPIKQQDVTPIVAQPVVEPIIEPVAEPVVPTNTVVTPKVENVAPVVQTIPMVEPNNIEATPIINKTPETFVAPVAPVEPIKPVEPVIAEPVQKNIVEPRKFNPYDNGLTNNTPTFEPIKIIEPKTQKVEQEKTYETPIEPKVEKEPKSYQYYSNEIFKTTNNNSFNNTVETNTYEDKTESVFEECEGPKLSWEQEAESAYERIKKEEAEDAVKEEVKEEVKEDINNETFKENLYVSNETVTSGFTLDKTQQILDEINKYLDEERKNFRNGGLND